MAKKKKPSKKSLSKKGKKTSSSSKKKYVGKKRGRKPSVPNRYNSIKTAISLNYQETINRKIKRYELKIIYDWIKDVYGNQSARYVLMNIDLIIDNFWQQYCNLYPVDITNHARFFEWYNLKTYFNDEKKYHYPTDIIELDLTAIGQGVFEFFFEEYPSKTEEVYEICKSEGIKRESPPPAFYLVSALCDITKKGNVFKYKLMMDSDIPLGSSLGSGLGSGNKGGFNENLGSVNNPINPNAPIQPVLSDLKDTSGKTILPPPLAPDISSKVTSKPFEPLNPNVVGRSLNPNISGNQGFGNNINQGFNLTPQQIEVEIQKEKIKSEFLLREQKLKELAELLKQGVITFKEYMEAVKEV